MPPETEPTPEVEPASEPETTTVYEVRSIAEPPEVICRCESLALAQGERDRLDGEAAKVVGISPSRKTPVYQSMRFGQPIQHEVVTVEGVIVA